MKKKLLYLIMVAAMLVFLFPVSAVAADGEGDVDGGKPGSPEGEGALASLEIPKSPSMLELVEPATVPIFGQPDQRVISPIVSDDLYDTFSGYCDDDIWDVYVADDGTDLYFGVELGCLGWTYLYIGIDADQNPATGYNTDADPWFFYRQPHGIGLDYMIEISTYYGYASVYAIDPVGNWYYFGDIYLGMYEGWVETGINLPFFSSVSGDSLPFDLVFSTWWDGLPEDEAPNTGYVTYPTGPPPIEPPTVTTGAADPVGDTTATLWGNITSTGGEDCGYRGFVWGTSQLSNPGDVSPQSSSYNNWWEEGDSFGTGAFSHAISVDPSTTYYSRAAATNSAGWSYGSEVEFTTEELLVLSVRTDPATDMTLTSATLNGYLLGLGPYSSANVSFGWDTVSHAGDPTAYSTWTTAVNTSAEPFSADISGLTEDIQHYFCARATADGETVYGDELSFYTLGPDDWTFMVYLDGDNNLNDAAIDDLNEMEEAGSTDAVNIVALLDLLDEPNSNVYYVTQDSTPAIASPVVDSLGEVNMGSATTLVDFVLWTVTNYPADHYALVLWNHGSGWKLQENSNPLKGICWDETSNNDYLTSPELAQALSIIYAETGAKLDIVGFDACLMGMAEIFYLIAPYADYGVASEEVEPWDGWPYDAILGHLIAGSPPGMAPDLLADTIVLDYMISYGHPNAGIETMSSVDSATMGSVSSTVDALATLLMDPQVVPAEDFGSIFWPRVATEETYYDPSYIDLYHFCQQLQAKFTTGSVYDAAGAVMTAITSAVINEGHGDYHPNFHGMSIYFPLTVEDYWMNYGVALAFTADTQWDEFLEWFYTQTVPEPDWTQFISDPQGDQFAAFGPDIANVAGAVIGDPQVAFRVTAHAPLDYSDITSYMLIDADQNITTGYTDPDFPIGVDYIAIVESAYMGEALSKFPIVKPEGMDTRQAGVYGLLGSWDEDQGYFYILASFPVFTEADYFWYGFPASLLGAEVNCMDIIELLGTWSDMTDIAPDEDYGTFCLSPVELPDLVISAKSEVFTNGNDYTVSFTVLNQPSATATAPLGHDVSLFIDGVLQAQTVEVPLDLAPGASWSSSFPTPITLYGIRNTITVCADCNEEVDELDERNNCLTNVFPEATLADALAAGKVWLAAQQRPDGSWGTWNQVAKTGLAVLKFETQAVEEEGIVPIDATYTYYSQIVTGLDYIMSNAHITTISPQPAGDPDACNDPSPAADGHGVYFHSPGNDWAAIYETSIAVMAIAASTHPEWVVTGGPLDGWTYEQVVLNAVDYLAWAQTDFGWGRGGWDYGPQNNSGDRSDQSNAGYATLALSYAEAPSPRGFGLPIPGMVRTELEVWVDYIQNTSGGWEDGGSGYDNPDWPNILRTGNLLQQFAWLGDTVAEPRVQAAIDYLVRHWPEPSEPGWRGDPASYQATFTTMKGLEALNIGLIDSIDWFQDFKDVLLAQQNLDGSWPVCVWDDGDQILATEWALLTLEKAVPEVIEKPDLVISEKGEQWVIEEETYTVSFVVRNRGNVAVTAQDHQVALYRDGQLIDQKAFPIDLAPGQTSKGTFATEVTLTGEWDEVMVCADSTGVVDELNEDNNCHRNIWTLLTVEVGDATITACTTTSVDVWVRSFPEGDYGLGCYTININFDPNMLEIVDADPDTDGFQVSPGVAPFDSPIAALYSDYISVTQYSTQMPGPTGDIKLFDLVFHCLRQGDTMLEPQIEVLADTNGDEIPAVCDPGLIRQIWMEADTDLGNAQDEDGLVTIPVSIDRLKDPSTDPPTTVTGIPIGAYEAAAYYDSNGIVMLDLLGGDSPFGSPTFNIYSDRVEFTDFDAYGSSAYPIIVARLVPSLIGPAGRTFVIDAPFDLIVTPDGGVIPEQDTVSKRFNRGDVNEDGTVNIIDAMKGAQHLVGLEVAGDINFLNMASVHRDGPDGDVKNIVDCMFIAQYVVGLRDNYFEPIVRLTYETPMQSNSPYAIADTWFFDMVVGSGIGIESVEYEYEGPHGWDDLLQAIGNGDVDCGATWSAMLPQLPLSEGLDLKYITHKPDALALAAKEVYHTFAPLREEWEVDHNVKVLYFLPSDTAALCSTSPVPTVADMDGLKVRVAGWPEDDAYQRFGASVVFLTYAEIYMALAVEVIDAAPIGFNDVFMLKLYEVAPYLTETWAGPRGMLATVINKDVWDSLPADVKSLMEGLTDDALDYYLEGLMQADRDAVDYMAANGVNFYIWPQAQRDIAEDLVQPDQTNDWIAGVGSDGAGLLAAFNAQLAIYEPLSTYQTGFDYWESVYGP